MRDWLQATFAIKFYYLFVVLVSLWLAARVAILTRLLIRTRSQVLSDAQLLNEVTLDVAARVVLAGGDGVVDGLSQTRFERIRAHVEYLAARCDSTIWAIRGALWLTLIVSVLAVVADAVPALQGELYGTHGSGSRALYLWAERLTTRLSIGLLLSASLALASTVFGVILRRRRAEWELALANRRRGAQHPEGANPPEMSD